MKKFFSLQNLFLFFISTFAFGQDNDTIPVNYCGHSAEFVVEINNQRFVAASTAQPLINDTSFRPSLYDPAAIVQCGRVRLYFDDIALNNNQGYDHPALGQSRINCTCDAIQYVQTVINFNPAANVDIRFFQSWNPVTNHDSTRTKPLGTAGTFYPDSFNLGRPEVYQGHVLNHITTGIDPDTGSFDGIMQINFDTLVERKFVSSDCSLPRAACDYDLYSLILHEFTHGMGWGSLIVEDSVTTVPIGVGNLNRFSLYDASFLHSGPTINALTKILDAAALTIQTGAGSIRNDRVWLNGNLHDNQPVFSSSGFIFPGLFLSHFDTLYRLGRCHDAPGFSPNYVMSMSLKTHQLKREYTNQEIRALRDLGYSINTIFNTIINNTPPYVDGQLLTLADKAANAYDETAIGINPNLVISSDAQGVISCSNPVTIDLSVRTELHDPDGDPIRIFPGSLFNIRGCGEGGNNHNRLVVTPGPNGDVITFTPRNNFLGLAQFGFHLWDGNEQGAFIVYTIRVSKDPACFNNGNQLIINGGFEEGSEITTITDSLVENDRLTHFEQQPYGAARINWLLRHADGMALNWESADLAVRESFVDCKFGYADFSFPKPPGKRPNPADGSLGTSPGGDRYGLMGTSPEPIIFFLADSIKPCRSYRLEFDVIHVYNCDPAVCHPNFRIIFHNTYDFNVNPLYQDSLMSVLLSDTQWRHFSIPIRTSTGIPATFMTINVPDPVGGLPYIGIDNISLLEDTNYRFVSNAGPDKNVIRCDTVGISIGLSPTGGNPPFTYSWSPSTGLSCNTCPSPLAKPAATTQYILTVTDSKGCSSTPDTVVVTYNPECCTGAQTISSAGALYNTNTTLNPASLAINGNIFIQSPATLTILCPDVRIADSVVIVVDTGAKLRIIGGSHLYACQNMWQGIVVLAGGEVIVDGGSGVEDAENGVFTIGNGKYTISSGAVFNKNYKDIVVNSFSGIHPGTVVSSNFLCQSYYANNPGSTLKFPHLGQRTKTHIEVNNVTQLIIGNSNQFKNADIGIDAVQSSLIVQNSNIFEQFTTIYSPPGVPGSPNPNIGTAIRSVDPTETRTLQVTNCIFQNGCFRAVESTGSRVVTINNNVIQNTAITDFNRAIFVRNFKPTLMNVVIKDNVITGYNTGIYYTLDIQKFFTPGGSVLNIEHNTIGSTLFNSHNAIVVTSTVPILDEADVGNWQIKNNPITGATTAIRVSGVRVPDLKIFANSSVNLRSGTGERRGIRLENCYNIEVFQNTINGTVTTNLLHRGIWATLSPQSLITCNNINNVGQSAVFHGTMFNTQFQLNNMSNANDGIVLLGNGIIGQQGISGTIATGKPSDNKWLGSFTRSQGLSINSNGDLSEFFVRNISPIYIPSLNKNVVLGTAVKIKFTATLGSRSCPSVGPGGGGGDPTPLMRNIVQDEITYAVNPDQARWTSMYQVFQFLTVNPTFITDSVLDYFYDSALVSNIGKIAEVRSNISEGNFSEAQSVNSNISPVNVMEQNFKSVNEVMIVILSSPVTQLNGEQTSFLSGIAGQCSETGGPAVYDARTLLESATGIISEYNDECGIAGKKENISNELSVAGNINVRGKIYPNPNDGNMQFDYLLGKGVNAWLVIIDLMGRDVCRYQLQEGSNSLSINDAALKNGVYFYKININNESVFTDKLVIIK